MKREVFLVMGYFSLKTAVFAGEDIGTVTSSLGYFDKIVDILQTLTHLFDGPLGMAAMVISVIVSMILWNVAPGRSEIIGRMCRVVVSIIVILNVAGLITYLGTD